MVDFNKTRMLRSGTPTQEYEEYGLWVKREDLSCKPPGPPFSKTRGVYAHVAKRPEKIIGVLDTVHSQAGHAVARACQLLGKKCINYYPVYKREGDPERGEHEVRDNQTKALQLGAKLHGLQAGRSCILFHQARKLVEKLGGYMMPNALKLEESVTETAKEVDKETEYDTIIIPTSSGTIAAGVIKGYCDQFIEVPYFVIHLGYSRSHDAVLAYLESKSGYGVDDRVIIVNEKYSYKDKARGGPTPPWPCNEYYDLKAFRWWMRAREELNPSDKVLFWNIG